MHTSKPPRTCLSVPMQGALENISCGALWKHTKCVPKWRASAMQSETYPHNLKKKNTLKDILHKFPLPLLVSANPLCLTQFYYFGYVVLWHSVDLFHSALCLGCLEEQLCFIILSFVQRILNGSLLSCWCQRKLGSVIPVSCPNYM